MASKNKNILDSLKVGIRSFPKDIFKNDRLKLDLKI